MHRRQLSIGLVVIAFVLLLPVLLSAQKSIRTVDFKNFTFPRSGQLLGHDRLLWLDPNTTSKIQMINGAGRARSSGFSLSSVSYADLMGDGTEDAIVVVHYDTGGTQQTDYIYIVAPSSAGPKVVAYCFTGDRAYSGLYKVWGAHNELIVELLDPDKAEGDCCSSGIIRTRYAWRNGRFERVGEPLRQPIPEPKGQP